MLTALLAFALRLYRIDAFGFWVDEGGSAEYAALPLVDLLGAVARHDPHPPLYHLLTALWVRLVGDSEFALRLPSALFLTLAVVAMYALALRVGGRPTALLTGLFVAANPLLVWYGQEARMYALLVLGAAVATLRLRAALVHGRRRDWVVHAALLGATLHVHYFAFALAGWHAVVAVLTGKDWRSRAAGLASVGASFLAVVPWLASAQLLGYSGWMEPVDLENALRRTAWAFSVGTSVYPEYGWQLAAPTLAAAALGGVYLALRRRLMDLLLIGGLVVAPVAASYGFGALTGRPSFHERYVIVGAGPMMLLAATGVVGLVSFGLRRGMGVGLGRAAAAASLVLGASALTAGILGADARSLAWHFGDARFAKEDVRGAARFVAARAGEGDLLIAAPGRASLYKRYGRIDLAQLTTDHVWTPQELEARLAPLAERRERVWMMPSEAEVDLDAQRWLDARAFRLDGRWFGLAPLKSWVQVPDPPGPGHSAELTLNGTPRLRAHDLRSAVRPVRDGHVLLVAGSWTALGALEPLKVSLRLLDERGRVVAESDQPLGAELNGTERWPPGTAVTRRWALRVPPDVPGGRYSARLVIYGGSPLEVRAGGAPSPGWDLGELELAPRPGAPEQVEPAIPADRKLGQRLRLIGYEAPTAAPAGGVGNVVLHWQSVGQGGWDDLARVTLGIGDARVGPDPTTLAGASRTPGSVLRETRELRLPRTLDPGSQSLRLRLEGPSPAEAVVTTLRVEAPAGRATAPPELPAVADFGAARLVGFDVEGQPTPGGRVAVGLHFAAAGPFPEDLTVFVHLVGPDGKIVAQHDARPCGGRCPTTAWVQGETIRDEHALQLPGALSHGAHHLVVGLYDGRTGARVFRADSVPGQRDHAVLTGVDLAA